MVKIELVERRKAAFTGVVEYLNIRLDRDG